MNFDIRYLTRYWYERAVTDNLNALRVKPAPPQWSPELPGPFPDDPNREEKIGDRMGGHRVAQAAFANNEPLIGHSAEHATEPLIMGKAENERGYDERQPVQAVERV